MIICNFGVIKIEIEEREQNKNYEYLMSFC